ncbi:uncharacterized protein BDR25DRAFT_238555 [Lindgomyces ingoldianus]|uniref:Uncharacterized protein n=1 Tax=Lindgomyces ingoldianus TaxID=673940 RepID=A0ACB6QGI4_9PLEO|nr:uncharacterized protein BDR25DRAFT_238555 [Lindgomyces ingoldianus]KAF2466001.1 hypothetical protein BDR25DRAFT_238555 [Lindgomyces ingoldianus]
MPRKPVKITPQSSSKRAAPGRPTPTRQSKRTKAAKGSYVEPESDEDIQKVETPPSGDISGMDYEDTIDEGSSSDSGHEEPSSEDDIKPKKGTPRGGVAKQTAIPMRKKQGGEKELWKHGAKLEPGTQLIIKKPKPREAGDIPYTDHTIHPNTLLFLKDLAANNDRQWLKVHDPDYRMALSNFTTFLEKLSEKVIEADETVPELPVKDIIFRIYRDVRFSKDQTPYKTHFSAAWSRTGRKGPYAAYYVQIQPGGNSFVGSREEGVPGRSNLSQLSLRLGRPTSRYGNPLSTEPTSSSEPSFRARICGVPRTLLGSGALKLVDWTTRSEGGGLWQPDAQPLALLRRDIDRKPQRIKRVLTDTGIRKEFLEGIPNDEKKAVKAFTNQSTNRSTALKKHPKGYENDHKDIELLRLRNFTLGTKLSDGEVVGAKGLERVAELVACMVPFKPTAFPPFRMHTRNQDANMVLQITYLNRVVMPDEDSSDSSDDEEEDGESGTGSSVGERDA